MATRHPAKFSYRLHGDVPKWLKGPHSKCGRSGNRRESSNLSISVVYGSLYLQAAFLFCVTARFPANIRHVSTNIYNIFQSCNRIVIYALLFLW